MTTKSSDDEGGDDIENDDLAFFNNALSEKVLLSLKTLNDSLQEVKQNVSGIGIPVDDDGLEIAAIDGVAGGASDGEQTRTSHRELKLEMILQQLLKRIYVSGQMNEVNPGAPRELQRR
jgi:hypothetical protein